MSGQSDKKAPVDITVGASLKAEVKTEIPSASSGRLLDALVDIIRPFSEKRGLKADQIRLQREDVLIDVARRARNRLELEKSAPNAIPNRVIVPLLEKASLCCPDDEYLKDIWAKLLISASDGSDINISLYASVISRLDPMHIRFLEYIHEHNGVFSDGVKYTGKKIFFRSDEVDFLISNCALLQGECGNGNVEASNAVAESIINWLREKFSREDEKIDTLFIQYEVDGQRLWSGRDYSDFEQYKLDDLENIVEGLRATGLIRTKNLDIKRYLESIGQVTSLIPSFEIDVVSFTEFGAGFFCSSCPRM